MIRFQPLRKWAASGFAKSSNIFFALDDLFGKFGEASIGCIVGKQHRWRRHVIDELGVGNLARFVDVLEHREERIKILHRDGIVFVIVTVSALQSQAEKSGS